MTKNKLKPIGIEKITEPGKYFDGDGLFLLVTEKGSKLWRLKYRIDGKEKLGALGTWPAVSLKEARLKAAEWRIKISAGIDPIQEKKALKMAAMAEELHKALTFEKVALEWLETYKQGRAYKSWENARGRLRNHVFPSIGALPFLDIRRSDYAAIVTALPTATPKSTGHKVASILKLIDDYGIDHYDLPGNRAQGLTRNIKSSRENIKHHAAITDEAELAKWLPIIENFIKHGKADPLIRYAFRLLILTGARLGALLKSEWQEIDIARAEWNIPAEHEKDGKPMKVFLSRQAMKTFKALRQYHEIYYAEGCAYCFPAIKGKKQPWLSDQSVEHAVKKIVPFEVSDLHGWRSAFGSLCEAHGWPHTIVAQAISHSKPGTASDHAYMRARHEELKRKLMQWYSDALDALRKKKKLPPVDLQGGDLYSV